MKLVVKNHNSGLFANFNTVLGALAHAEELGMSCAVDWSRNWKSTDFPYGTEQGNVWEMLFEQPTNADVPDDDVVEFDVSTSRWAHADMYEPTQRAHFHHLYVRYIRPRPHILRRVDEFWARHLAGRPTVGVHIRHPHHVQEQYGRPMPDMDDYHRVIAAYVDRAVCFVASDLQDVCETLRSRYGDAVVFQTDVARVSSTTDLPVFRNNPQPGPHLAEDVLSDCLLLSRCDDLYGVYSNVTGAACLMNPALRFHLLNEDAVAPSYRGAPSPGAGLSSRLWLVDAEQGRTAVGSGPPYLEPLGELRPGFATSEGFPPTWARRIPVPGHVARDWPAAGDICLFHVGRSSGSPRYLWFASVQGATELGPWGSDSRGERGSATRGKPLLVTFDHPTPIDYPAAGMAEELSRYCGIEHAEVPGTPLVCVDRCTVAAIVHYHGSLVSWLTRLVPTSST